MILAHTTNRRMIGPSLDALASECNVLLDSAHNSSPGAYDDAQWIAAPYTSDGTNVAAIIHNEYHGFAHDNCAAPPEEQFSTCWSSSVTLGASANQGDTFTHAAPPGHFVAALPYRYSASQTRNTGLFAPSNIIQKQPQPQQDDYYYLFVEATGDDSMNQQFGVCVLRTRTLDDPTSWRAWDGDRLQPAVRGPVRQFIRATGLAPLPAGVAARCARAERAGDLQQLSRPLRDDRRVGEVPGRATGARPDRRRHAPWRLLLNVHGPCALDRPQAPDGGAGSRLLCGGVESRHRRLPGRRLHRLPRRCSIRQARHATSRRRARGRICTSCERTRASMDARPGSTATLCVSRSGSTRTRPRPSRRRPRRPPPAGPSASTRRPRATPTVRSPGISGTSMATAASRPTPARIRTPPGPTRRRMSGRWMWDCESRMPTGRRATPSAWSWSAPA